MPAEPEKIASLIEGESVHKQPGCLGTILFGFTLAAISAVLLGV